MIAVTSPGQSPVPGRAADASAARPATALDCLRRLNRVLDLAASVITEFGTCGFSDDQVPELSFGPEKVVAETAMLAHAASGLTSDPATQRRIDALLDGVDRLSHAPSVLVDLCLEPHHTFHYAVPHGLLAVHGRRSPALDALFARRCAWVTAHTADLQPAAVAEHAWILRVWRPDADSTAATCPRPAAFCDLPVDVLNASRADAYALTHELFYLTDFGRNPHVSLGRSRQSLLADVECLLVRFMDAEDYDLSGELLMAWPLLGEPWSPMAAFFVRVLFAVEEAVGHLPCGNLDLDRLAGLDRAAARRYTRATSYHTAYVMGFLCAAMVRAHLDLKPAPAGVHPPQAGREPGAALASGRGHWQGEFESLPDAEREALGAMLVGFELVQAVASRDFGAVHQALLRAGELGVVGPLQRGAGELLAVLEDAMAAVG